MKISINKVSDAIVEAKIEFDPKEWVAAQEKAYKKLSEEIEVKGFRKGAAPLNIAKKHIEPAKAMTEALDIIIPTGFEEIQKQNKFEILVRPNVNVDEVSAEKLIVTYTLTSRPNVKLGIYKDIEISKHEVVVNDEDIDRELQNLAKNLAVVGPKEDDIVANGDIVNFDFEGYTDGVAFEGGKAEKYELEIGSNMFVPGFEEQLIGKKVGQKCEIAVKFPDNYVKELAGKNATFKILIHSIKSKTIPAIDDDLAKDAQMEGVDNLDQLKEKIKADLFAKKSVEADKLGFNLLIEQIVSKSELTIPNTLIENDTQAGFERFKKDVEGKGIPFDKYCEVTGMTEDKVKENIKTDVEKNLRAVFVLSEIAKENEIKVLDADIEEEIKKIADQYKMTAEDVKKAFGNRINEIANQVFSRKVNDYLRSVNKLS
ncbi:MAG: trigger factor [Bacilli bacterium]|nr:trigger factor [Bacilli bacterium]